jgi:hypothetical protein
MDSIDLFGSCQNPRESKTLNTSIQLSEGPRVGTHGGREPLKGSQALNDKDIAARNGVSDVKIAAKKLNEQAKTQDAQSFLKPARQSRGKAKAKSITEKGTGSSLPVWEKQPAWRQATPPPQKPAQGTVSSSPKLSSMHSTGRQQPASSQLAQRARESSLRMKAKRESVGVVLQKEASFNPVRHGSSTLAARLAKPMDEHGDAKSQSTPQENDSHSSESSSNISEPYRDEHQCLHDMLSMALQPLHGQFSRSV